MLQNSEGAAKIAAIESYLKYQESSIDGEALALELLLTNNFLEKVIQAIIKIAKGIATVASDLKGIGLGVAYHYSLPKQIKSKGKEQGVEAIYIFQRTVGGAKVPSQSATRKWDYDTTRLKFDVIGRANLNVSLWFGNPASADLLAGVLGELGIIVAISANAVGIVPKSDNLTKEVGSIPWPSVINSVSLGLGVGLGAGAAVITGSQDVSIRQSNMSLFVSNPDSVDNSAVMKIGQPTTLKVTLTHPSSGKTPIFDLKQNETTLSLVMPNFLLDSLTTATVTPPANWESTGTSGGGFNFQYTGTSGSWTDDLEFTISNLESNSNITSGQTGFVQAQMKDITRNSGFPSIPGFATASLELTSLIFNASIDWGVTLGTGFKAEGSTQEKNITIETPPQKFQTLPYGQTPTVITETSSGRQWNVGFKFQINSSQEPAIVIAWQEVENPPVRPHYFATGQTPVTTTKTSISIGYMGNSQSDTQFEVQPTRTS